MLRARPPRTSTGRRVIAVVLAGLGWLLLSGAALACAPRPATPANPDAVPAATCEDRPFAEVEIETRPRLGLELARTPDERALGLMFRESLPWDTGMLFEFQQPSRAGFWMRNTSIPLSIAWLDRDGTIVDIQDMQPLSDEVHTPSAPYWYAIEANQGWFEANGVGVGQRVCLCLGTNAGG